MTYGAGYWAGVRVLLTGRLRTAGGVILAYHDVGEPGPRFTRYSVTPARLRWQLTTAASWGLRFVALPELIDQVVARDDVPPLGAVVFDDCLAGVYRHAAPILADLGIPSTLFAVSDQLGRSPGWWPGSDRVMTEHELRELIAHGCALGSHSRTHRSLVPLGAEALRSELEGSRRALQDLGQRAIPYFAYPFGHHDRRVREAVVDAGYTAAFTFVNGRLTPDLDVTRLPRVAMHNGLRRLRLALHLARSPEQWPDTQRDMVGRS